MALAEILRARADALRRTARAECGELGTVTLEALPLRELEGLLRQPDASRAVFYAACRELQRAGEELRRAGQVYTPDGVLQMVSDSEAEQAARTVLELSGWRQSEKTASRTGQVRGAASEAVNRTDVSGEAETRMPDAGTSAGQMPAPENASPPVRVMADAERADAETGGTDAGRLRETGEIRLLSVQESGEGAQEIRPASVQIFQGRRESRLLSVQKKREPTPPSGQDSHETGSPGGGSAARLPVENSGSGGGRAVAETLPEPDKKAQGLGAFSKFETQNVGSAQKALAQNRGALRSAETGLHESKTEFLGELHESKSEFGGEETEFSHETESEFRKKLHETKSAFSGSPHEAESELAGDLHEITSEVSRLAREGLHESTSESGRAMHESKSEFGGAGPETAHESKSEYPKELHETTSELTERVARCLLEGLRRASAVR